MDVLFDHCDRQRITRDGPIVFVHTGGLSALFHYADELTADSAAPISTSEESVP
jgi:hypothetical protein